MRTIKQYLEAAKARKENGEAGFSLVELIVVVVILGILAAIAIPIFNNVQDNAREGAAKAAAANAVTSMATQLAGDPSTVPTPPADTAEFTYTVVSNGTNIEDICVSAEHTGGGDPQEAGNC